MMVTEKGKDNLKRNKIFTLGVEIVQSDVGERENTWVTNIIRLLNYLEIITQNRVNEDRRKNSKLLPAGSLVVPGTICTTEVYIRVETDRLPLARPSLPFEFAFYSTVGLVFFPQVWRHWNRRFIRLHEKLRPARGFHKLPFPVT